MTISHKNPLWIAVVGPKKSGKTTFIEVLIPYLKAKGYRVATVKHSSHRHAFDREGSDSHRHAQAGAERVVLRSPGANLFIAYDLPEEEAGRQTDEFLSNFDVVICEGFRDSDYPKIVIETGASSGEISPPVIVQVKVPTQSGQRPIVPEKVLQIVAQFVAVHLPKDEIQSI